MTVIIYTLRQFNIEEYMIFQMNSKWLSTLNNFLQYNFFISKMFKKAIVVGILAVLGFSSEMMVGGYKKVDTALLGQLRGSQVFKVSEELARKEYLNKNNGQLGPLISVEQQIVAGVNYKMTFLSENGNVVVTVFAQPWTQTYEVSQIRQEN